MRSQLASDHETTKIVFCDVFRLDRIDIRSIPEHRDSIGMRDDFGEVMRNKDHGPPVRTDFIHQVV